MSHAPPSHPSTAHANTVPISRPLRIFLVAAIAVAALGASRTPAHAARGMEVALQDDSSFVAQIGLKRKKALAFAAKLHVTRLRVNIPWVAVVNKAHSSRRPKKRHYDFTSYDALFNKARAKGIRLQLTISGFAPAPNEARSRACSIAPFPATPASSRSAAEPARCRSISRAPIVWSSPRT